MAEPLGRAANALAGGYQERDKLLVLVTDGRVGNEDQILRSLSPQLKNIRVYTIGIDRAVNEGFLRRLAELGGGAYELVESEQRLDAIMDRVHQQIGTPVLTELAVSFGEGTAQMTADTQTPRRIPALFDGAPLVVSGRCTGATPPSSLCVQGCDATGQAWKRDVDVTAVENSALRSIWARAQLRALEDAYVTKSSALGSAPALRREIVGTSLRFGVLSRFTAFVAVDEAIVNPGGDPHKALQAVESVEAEVQGLSKKKGSVRSRSSQSFGAPEDSASAISLSELSLGSAAPMAPQSQPSPYAGGSSPESPMMMSEYSAHSAPMAMAARKKSSGGALGWIVFVLLAIAAAIAYFLGR